MANNSYTFESRVRISEAGSTGRLTLPGVINYFQDCSTLQSESLNLGVKYFQEHQRAWVLSYWQIEVDRYPMLGEKVTSETWATSFQGMFGERNFQLWDEEKCVVARAHSLWVYMDMAKGRPNKPQPEEVDPYGQGEALEMERESRKIARPEHTEEREAFCVRRYQIDTNQHMNNCQYVQLAMELVDEEFCPHKIRVEYKKSAVYNDIIVPKIAVEEERIVVELCDEAGGLYAIVELKK